MALQVASLTRGVQRSPAGEVHLCWSTVAQFADASAASVKSSIQSHGSIFAAGRLGVRRWDASGRSEVFLPSDAIPAGIHAIAVAGNSLFCCSSDGNISSFDIATGTKQKTFSGHIGEIVCAATWVDPRTGVVFLATGGVDFQVKTWTADGQALAASGHHHGRVNCLLIMLPSTGQEHGAAPAGASPAQHSLPAAPATALPSTVLGTGQAPSPRQRPHRPSNTSRSSAGSGRSSLAAVQLTLGGLGPLLISGCSDGSLFVWEDRQGSGMVADAEGWLLKHPLQKGVTSLQGVGGSIWAGCADGRVNIWDPSSDGVGFAFRQDLKPHSDQVSCLQLVGKHLWSGSADRTICGLLAATGELLYRIPDQGGYVKALVPFGWTIWAFTSKGINVLASEAAWLAAQQHGGDAVLQLDAKTAEVQRLTVAAQDHEAQIERLLAESASAHGREQAGLMAQHAKYEGELAAQRAKHEAQSADVRQALQEQLLAQQDKHAAELAAQRAQHEAELAAQRAEHEAELAAQHVQHEAELAGGRHQIAAQQEQHEAELAAQRAAHAAETATAQQQLDELRARLSEQLAEQQAKHDSAMALEKEKYEAQLSEMQQRVVELEAAQRDAHQEQQARHIRALTALQFEHEGALAAVQQQLDHQRALWQEQLAEQRGKHAASLAEQQTKHEAALAAQRALQEEQAHAAEVQATVQQAQSEAEITAKQSSLEERHAAEVAALAGQLAAAQAQLEEHSKNQDRVIGEHKLALENARAEHGRELKVVRADPCILSAAAKDDNQAEVEALEADMDAAIAALHGLHAEQLAGAKAAAKEQVGELQEGLAASQEAAADQARQHETVQLQQLHAAAAAAPQQQRDDVGVQVGAQGSAEVAALPMPESAELQSRAAHHTRELQSLCEEHRKEVAQLLQRIEQLQGKVAGQHSWGQHLACRERYSEGSAVASPPQKADDSWPLPPKTGAQQACQPGAEERSVPAGVEATGVAPNAKQQPDGTCCAAAVDELAQQPGSGDEEMGLVQAKLHKAETALAAANAALQHQQSSAAAALDAKNALISRLEQAVSQLQVQREMAAQQAEQAASQLQQQREMAAQQAEQASQRAHRELQEAQQQHAQQVQAAKGQYTQRYEATKQQYKQQLQAVQRQHAEALQAQERQHQAQIQALQQQCASEAQQAAAAQEGAKSLQHEMRLAREECRRLEACCVQLQQQAQRAGQTGAAAQLAVQQRQGEQQAQPRAAHGEVGSASQGDGPVGGAGICLMTDAQAEQMHALIKSLKRKLARESTAHAATRGRISDLEASLQEAMAGYQQLSDQLRAMQRSEPQHAADEELREKLHHAVDALRQRDGCLEVLQRANALLFKHTKAVGGDLQGYAAEMQRVGSALESLKLQPATLPLAAHSSPPPPTLRAAPALPLPVLLQPAVVRALQPCPAAGPAEECSPPGSLPAGSSGAQCAWGPTAASGAEHYPGREGVGVGGDVGSATRPGLEGRARQVRFLPPNGALW